MKLLICLLPILVIAELAILIICFVFYIKQFSFESYMEQLYEKFNCDLDGSGCSNIVIEKFEDLFNDYKEMSGLDHLIYKVLGFIPLLIIFIFLISSTIGCLCQKCRKNCCKCQKKCSYMYIIAAIVFSVPYIVFAHYAKNKIDLTDEEIYQFDDDFNQKTKKNLKFMKTRKIILIAGVIILYAMYVAHIILLCMIKKKKTIEEDNNTNIVNIDNEGNCDAVRVNNNAYGHENKLNTNSNRIEEK